MKNVEISCCVKLIIQNRSKFLTYLNLISAVLILNTDTPVEMAAAIGSKYTTYIHTYIKIPYVKTNKNDNTNNYMLI